MALLGSSSGLLFITGFINDLEAMGNVVLITLENNTTLGRTETSGGSRRKSSERCRDAADGSRGLGDTTAGFYLIQAPGAVLQFSPDKRGLIAFVDVEGVPREVRQEGLVRGRHPWGAFPPPSVEEWCLACSIGHTGSRQNKIGSEGWLTAEVLPASRLYSGT